MLSCQEKLGKMAGSKTCFSYVSLTLALLLCSAVHTEQREIGIDRDVAKTWCIAAPNGDTAAQQSDLDRLCNNIVDCSSIQPGASCFNPNTVQDHVSVAYNLYYRAHASQASACASFGGNAFQTVSDPSHGSCIFA